MTLLYGYICTPLDWFHNQGTILNYFGNSIQCYGFKMSRYRLYFSILGLTLVFNLYTPRCYLLTTVYRMFGYSSTIRTNTIVIMDNIPIMQRITQVSTKCCITFYDVCSLQVILICSIFYDTYTLCNLYLQWIFLTSSRYKRLCPISY